MEFRFINNNEPLDRRSQKQVRNHAMKGKNLGRTILARGHKKQQKQGEIRPDCCGTESKCSTEDDKRRPLLPKTTHRGSSPNMGSPLNPFSGTELAYFTGPVPLTSSVRYLFYEFHYSVSKELYPPVFCCQPEGNETTWFERVIEVPSVFHCAMAVTRARISHSQGYSESLESTKHLLQALRLLRHDISANSNPQFTTIVVAISLAMHANLTGSTRESRTHLEGLKSILELRSGDLVTLCSSSPEVGNKIRRCDQELSLLAGTPTIFGSQLLPQPELPYVVPVDDRRSCVTLPHPLEETDPVIRFAMTDALALCKYAGRAQLSAFQYQNLLVSIIQRLIDYAPLGGKRPPHPLNNACQLGLLAFMSTLLDHTRETGSIYSTLLSDLLWASIDSFDDEMAYGRVKDYFSLHLWLVFIYAVSAPEQEQSWNANLPIVRRIRILANELALAAWEDIATRLRVYPWVDAFHSKQSRKLWDIICRQ